MAGLLDEQKMGENEETMRVFKFLLVLRNKIRCPSTCNFIKFPFNHIKIIANSLQSTRNHLARYHCLTAQTDATKDHSNAEKKYIFATTSTSLIAKICCLHVTISLDSSLTNIKRIF